MAEETEGSLKYTPTWTVAVVCTVFVTISLCLERGIHRLGKTLKRRNQKPLYEALEKLKEELMLLGFISLLLTVFQGSMNRLCIPESFTNHMLPCKRAENAEGPSSEDVNHSRQLISLLGSNSRRLLSSGGSEGSHCKKGMKPFLSVEAMHQLHIFIFVLAIVHVLFSVLTMLLGSAKIRTWKPWEEDIQTNRYKPEDAMNRKTKVTHVAHDHFVKTHAMGTWGKSALLSWMVSFLKQFYGSVRKSDYSTLRLGFIQKHCPSNSSFDFHKYMMRTLEADFKKVVGISAYLWGFVVIFLLLNIEGWHTYFWIAFIPLILLLAVGAKLEHIIAQLAQEVAEKHTAVDGDIVVRPSDDHFWFHRPKLVLYLIHFILFQNAFEIAFFFWILTTYGFDSCIMGKVSYIIPRLVVGVIIQVLCSYSTFPLYALVTQMGTKYKKAIFDEYVHERLSVWTQKAKANVKGKGRSSNKSDDDDDKGSIQLLKMNGTSQIQAESIHDSGKTECIESKIDIPKSS